VFVASAGEIEPRISGTDPVSDVGDKAGWSTDAGVMFAVAGGKGLHVIVGVGVSNGGSAEHKAWEKAAGISVTRNAFAALGLGKPDDSTVPTGAAKQTTTPPASSAEKTTEPAESSDPAEPSEPEETTETPEN
jgi:hypothetical protein